LLLLRHPVADFPDGRVERLHISLRARFELDELVARADANPGDTSPTLERSDELLPATAPGLCAF
jgi:hypothetical protein